MSPTGLTLIQALIIGAVAYRIWRFFARDDLTAGLRRGGAVHFVDCPWCLGFWITAAVTAGVWWLWGLENPWLAGLTATVICGWLGERL